MGGSSRLGAAGGVAVLPSSGSSASRGGGGGGGGGRDRQYSDDEADSLFHCPLTGQVMQDPVTAPSGRSYERVAVEGYIAAHGTEPFSETALAVSQLVPNAALRKMIEKMKPE